MRSLVERIHADELRLAGCDDELAAGLERNAMFGAEGLGRGRALATKARLEASRRIIDAGVYSTPLLCPVWCRAMAASFSRRNIDAPGRALAISPRGGEADNASAYDAIIMDHV